MRSVDDDSGGAANLRGSDQAERSALMRAVVHMLDGHLTVHVLLSERNIDALGMMVRGEQRGDAKRPALIRGDGETGITLVVEAERDPDHYRERLDPPGAMTWEVDWPTSPDDGEADDGHEPVDQLA